MKVKKEILFPIILAAILSATLLAFMPRTHAAAASTTLEIIPASNTYYINSLAPGSTFKLNVSVVNVTNLFAWQINVTWDPTVLNYSSISEPADSVFAGQSTYVTGTVTGNNTVIRGVTLAPGGVAVNVTGTGTLTQLTLKVLDQSVLPQSCNVSFERFPPYAPSDTFLLDLNGADIAFTPQNATFTYDLMMDVFHTVTAASLDFTVETYSNTSIAPNSVIVNETAKTIAFNVTGLTGQTAGFVNVTIPQAFLNASSASAWTITVNGTAVSPAPQITTNSTHTFIYLTFNTSKQTVVIQGTQIVPELPYMILMFMITSSAVTVAVKIKTRKK